LLEASAHGSPAPQGVLPRAPFSGIYPATLWRKALNMTTGKGASDLFKPVRDLLASVKLTVVVLICLALTSIIGTLIPQNESPSAYLRAYGELWYRVFFILDIFDMYHSWWFRLLLVILGANVVFCSIDRLSSTWKI